MTKAFDCAVRLLSRREHGAAELATKLVQKGYEQEDIPSAISECQRLGYQSDSRFAESLCRVRIRQGYGPLKIAQELQTKQVARELIERVLEQEQDQWLDHALDVWHKKYQKQAVLAFAELQKRQRFLLYRGFPTDVITNVVKAVTTSQK